MKRSKKIKAMLQTIRERGDIVQMSDALSDEQAELFLQEILNWPDCKDEAQRSARTGVSRRPTDH